MSRAKAQLGLILFNESNRVEEISVSGIGVIPFSSKGVVKPNCGSTNDCSVGSSLFYRTRASPSNLSIVLSL